MGTRTISFRIDAEKVDSLDKFAASLDRDRSFLLNEAIDNYLELQARQISQIKKSLKQAEAGDLTPQEDVEKLAKTWGPASLRVTWTSEAIQSLRELHEYIAQDSLKAADKVVSRIFSETRYLVNFPGAGRRGRVKGTRELVVAKTPYVVAYHVGKADIQILAVQHGARQWPDSF